LERLYKGATSLGAKKSIAARLARQTGISPDKAFKHLESLI